MIASVAYGAVIVTAAAGAAAALPVSSWLVPIVVALIAAAPSWLALRKADKGVTARLDSIDGKLDTVSDRVDLLAERQTLYERQRN